MRLTKMRLTTTKKIIGGLALAASLTLAGVAVSAHRGHSHGQDGGHGFGPSQGGPGGRGFGRGPGGHRGGGNPLGPLARDLNLTDAQKAEVRKITDGFEESTKALREQLFKAGGGPADGLTDGAFDEAAVRTAAQARAGVQVELEVARARMMSQVYALLTAEQKAKIAERRQQFEQRRREFESGGGETPEGR